MSIAIAPASTLTVWTARSTVQGADRARPLRMSNLPKCSGHSMTPPFDIAVGQSRAHVRAAIVGGEKLAIDVIDRQFAPSDLDMQYLPARDVGRARDNLEVHLGHRLIRR